MAGDSAERARGARRVRRGGLQSALSYRGEYAGLDPSVRDVGAGRRWSAGPDGLERLRRLVVRGAAVSCGTGGWLALEVDCARAHEVAGLATEAGWSGRGSVYDDLFGRARYLLARRSETA